MALVLAEKSSPVIPSSTEDDDLLIRSSKKIKNGESHIVVDEWPSLGSKEDSEPLCIITEDPNHNFPTFLVSEKMKKRLYKAWNRAVIAKLLGRTIGYKLLLSILQSLWAKRGVISLINIGNRFFVVKLTNKDYLNALTGGSWMIFDHYLTKPIRKKRSEKDKQVDSNLSPAKGSRFGILNVEEGGVNGDSSAVKEGTSSGTELAVVAGASEVQATEPAFKKEQKAVKRIREAMQKGETGKEVQSVQIGILKSGKEGMEVTDGVKDRVTLGNFNDIASATKKTGGNCGTDARIHLFADRLSRCKLSDLGFCGPPFTWKGQRLLGGRRILTVWIVWS
ncbi:hypothetical protein K1719_010152 [Acacia pycnantha]|nr:hypothetical protein K1719_010152 [Acacia pycnantha]